MQLLVESSFFPLDLRLEGCDVIAATNILLQWKKNPQGGGIYREGESTVRKKPQKGKNPHGGRNQRKSLGCVKTFLKLTVFAHVFNNVDYWIPFEFFLSFVRWFSFFFLVTCNLEC